LFASGCLALCGCGEKVEEYDGYVYDGPVNSCNDDSDCPEGACHLELSRCVLPVPDDGRTYHVKVVPQSDIGVQSQVFEVSVGSNGFVAEPLEILDAVTVNPQIQTLAGDVALQGRVIFIDVGNQLPGRPPRLTVYESSGSAFDFQLLPSTYNIIAIPEGVQSTSFPVTYYSGIVLDEIGFLRPPEDLASVFHLIVPPAETEVFGVVRQGDLEMNGLTVVAVDPATGRIASTEDATACVEQPETSCGFFSIRLAAGVESFALEISRPAEPHHPVFTVGPFTVPDAVETLDLTGNPLLSLDPLGVPVRYHAGVEKPVQTAEGEIHDPAPGCFVLFESDDVAGGSVSRWVGTNESGAIEESEGVLGVNLYPGEYMVTVIPAEVSSEALVDYTAFISPGPITISGPSGGQVFTLQYRPLYKGNVVAWGEAVPQVTLVAQPHLGEADFPRSSSASTGLDGHYSLWLDPGTYRVVAEAPPESGFAWGASLFDVEGNGSFDLGLPLPFVAQATVFTDIEGIEVGGAVVEWYFTDTDGRAYTIARVASDADGVVTALLPH
jgi:hypothetical protein